MQTEIKSNFEKLLDDGGFSNSQKEIKEKNFNKFLEQGFPNKRIEDWKFSDLNQIISTNFKKLDFYKKNNASSIDADFINEFDHNKIVFVNGNVSKIDFSYENKEEIIQVMDDLRSAEVDFITIGQYLQTSVKNHHLHRYYHQNELKELASIAKKKDI